LPTALCLLPTGSHQSLQQQFHISPEKELQIRLLINVRCND
jgi:hypothetical protein